MRMLSSKLSELRNRLKHHNGLQPDAHYKHKIAFDQHVWLPEVKGPYKSILDLMDDRAVIDALLSSKLNISTPDIIPSPFSVDSILKKLTDEDIFTIDLKLSELKLAHTAHNRLAIASHLYPSMHFKLGTSIINPPDDVHRMQKGDPYYIGDMYSSDLIVSSLAKKDLAISAGKSYLDFGCSSGSLLRVLKAYQPAANFFGVDPITSSIEWAQSNIDDVQFSVSSINPPLNFDTEMFDGISAISIWSHLGETEAVSWFDEMHRILKPGGWLIFTTHGESSLSFYNRTELYLPRRILALLEALNNSDFVFEEVYLGVSPEGLSAKGYGNAYVRKGWIEKRLSHKWRILYFGGAENQGNQDIYILQRD